MMSKEEAIAKVVEQNNKVQNLLQHQNKLRFETDQRCSALQNEANQLVGRNDAIREMFELTQEELQEAVAADEKRRNANVHLGGQTPPLPTPPQPPVVLPDPPPPAPDSGEPGKL